MTLHVPFEQFAKTVERLLDVKEAFVAPHGHGSRATAANAAKGILVVCHTDHPPDTAKLKLKHSGLELFDGGWSASEEPAAAAEDLCEAYVAAVSYKSSESMPGVWIDAHPTQPTAVQVLRLMYDEFRETGELPDVSFEEFVRLSEPNVIVVSPNEIQGYLERKLDCP